VVQLFISATARRLNLAVLAQSSSGWRDILDARLAVKNNQRSSTELKMKKFAISRISL
jgi:hypothetical protein